MENPLTKTVGCHADLVQKAKLITLEWLFCWGLFIYGSLLISGPPTIAPIFFILISDRISDRQEEEKKGHLPPATLLCCHPAPLAPYSAPAVPARYNPCQPYTQLREYQPPAIPYNNTLIPPPP